MDDLCARYADTHSRKCWTRKPNDGVQHPAFHIDKEGAGQVVVIGPANVGKSALIVALTNASPEVSDAPYTTWKPTPGMMLVEDIQIQTARLWGSSVFEGQMVQRDYILQDGDVVELRI